MSTVTLKEAEAGLSGYVDEASKGRIVTITRHGKPVAALVPLAAAEIAQKSLREATPSFASYLKTFPAGELGEEFDRNPSPSRDVDL